MKTIVKSTLLALAMAATVGMSAQDAKTSYAEVERYAKMFDLNDEQISQLNEVYDASAANEQAIKDRMTAQRAKLAEARKSDEENLKWKNDMNSLAEERRTIRENRDSKLKAILNKEQLVTYSKWKDGSLNRDELRKKMQQK